MSGAPLRAPDDPSRRVALAARVRFAEGCAAIDLTHGWEITTGERALPAIVPGTVAMVVPESEHAELDAHEHVYRTRFATPSASGSGSGRTLLAFDGLATICEVSLNGARLFESRSMFIATAWDVTDLLRADGGDNELTLTFRALLPVLRARQPRGRWPTRLVTEKHLRFVRTTLLGYMPGFCPNVRPVGPYAGVRLIVQSGVAVERVKLTPRLAAIDASGLASGMLHVDASIAQLDAGALLQHATLIVEGHDHAARVAIAQDAQRVHGAIAMKALKPWWPHTHGEPALYSVALELRFAHGTQRVELGRVGFRSIARSAELPGDFGVVVNGVPVFARGACWTTPNLAALHARGEELERALELVRDAGMNMLRVAGTTTYESDAFYGRCDALGILVFQDFMFANLDYPIEDATFAAAVKEEATQLLERLSGRPSLAVLCGGSEVEQQAAMMGFPEETWRHPLVHEVLKGICAAQRDDVPYVSNSPSEGELPFSVSEGTAHYFGVGAYLRRLDDARACRLKFATECLSFSNAPEPETLAHWLGTATPKIDERYLAGVVRDLGAGWTFADVTDHYARELFGSDPKQLAQDDPARYLAQSRAASAEMIGRALGIWRAREHGCRGALIWFLRDLILGAGWGVIDARGVPKAPYYAMKRACAPIAMQLIDHGLDGIVLHAWNDGAQDVAAWVEVELYRADGVQVEGVRRDVLLPARGELRLRVDALLGHFADSSYAFRFGPPQHALVAGRLWTERGGEAGSDCIAPLGLASALNEPPALTATARASGKDTWDVTLQAARFAPFVAIDAPGFYLSNNYVHVAPGKPQRLYLVARDTAARTITIQSLNAAEPLHVALPEGP